MAQTNKKSSTKSGKAKKQSIKSNRQTKGTKKEATRKSTEG
ncbi:hypothetical protein [Nonomuraea rhizosphaerae]|nr:hypothetical protein [Nonomuraea rhizosphaerae]